MKLKKIRDLLLCPKELPAETALCLTFFFIAVFHTATNRWDEASMVRTSAVNADVLWFFVPLFILTFYLHRVNHWAYVLSYFLYIPLMAMNLEPFLWSTAFYFTYVLAAIILVIGTKKMDNRPFADHLLHVVTKGFFGVLVAGIFNIAVMVIVGSFIYIFGIDASSDIYEYIYEFVWFVVAPLTSAFFITRDEYAEAGLPKVMSLILNGILTPAIIIYTIILYAYFIKIAITWNLPKGGVAYMVMAFVTVSLAGYLTQYILPKRYYDWFYKNFTWIAIPPLIMFWIGSLYRIRLYSFTEGRFYLLVAGMMMTLFVLMLLWKRTRLFQLMALIFAGAIILFTYIPGISAKDVGLRCQTARLEQMIKQLHLTDKQTGKFIKILDTQRIASDSLLSSQYLEANDVAGYVKKAMGTSRFEKKYGKWELDSYSIRYNNQSSKDIEILMERTVPIELDDYVTLLNPDHYRVVDNDTAVILYDDNLEKIVINEKMKKAVKEDSPQTYAYSNDSLLVVFSMVYTDSTFQVCGVRNYNFQVFERIQRVVMKGYHEGLSRSLEHFIFLWLFTPGSLLPISLCSYRHLESDWDKRLPSICL